MYAYGRKFFIKTIYNSIFLCYNVNGGIWSSTNKEKNIIYS